MDGVLGVAMDVASFISFSEHELTYMHTLDSVGRSFLMSGAVTEVFRLKSMKAAIKMLALSDS